MGKRSRSRSRDKSRHKEHKEHKEHKQHKESKDRRSPDRKERPERERGRVAYSHQNRERDDRDKFSRPDSHKAVDNKSSVNAYEQKIKDLLGSRGTSSGFNQGYSRWAEPPEDLRIRGDDGEILEDFLKSTQNPNNSQKVIKSELSKKFNESLHSAKLDQPRIDQTDIESRNRYQGSADPYEQSSYGVPTAQVIQSYDKAKHQRKIYIPKNKNFNYTGFIIGPKGTNQKRLEEETGCKILVRGKGSQKEGQPAQTDESDELHVLITADDQQTLMKGVVEIEKIIFADEETRNELKRFQLNLMAKIKHDEIGGGIPSNYTNGEMDLSLTTPYGPPSSDARTISVPRVCIGLVIGKGGETIRRLQAQSGATKVQVAADNAPGSEFRNVFIEGSNEACMKVKAMLNEIVENHMKLQEAQQNKQSSKDTVRIIVKIPCNIIGMVIGKSGETIKYISSRTGAVVYMDKEEENRNDLLEKTIIISGTRDQSDRARKEIDTLVRQKNLTLKYFEQKPGEDFPSDLMNRAQYTMGGYSTPGYEHIHELQKWMTTENWYDYYNSTSTVTTTEYYPDGTVKMVKDTADNNLESMPDITNLMKEYLPAPKGADELAKGGFIDPNALRTEEEMKRHGGKYFEHTLPGMGVAKEPAVRGPGPRVMMFQPEDILGEVPSRYRQ